MEHSILHRVNEVSARLIRGPKGLADLDSILHHIAQTAQDAFATNTLAVLAFNPITGKFIDPRITVGNLHSKSESVYEQPMPYGMTQQVLREGMLLIQDLEETPEYQSPFTRREDIRSLAGLALRTRHRQRPLGVIYLGYRQVQDFNATDYEKFTSFATQAALLLQEIWLERHLEAVAHVGQEINHNLATVEDLFLELQMYVDTVLDESHKLVLGLYQPQTNGLDLHIREHQQTSRLSLPLQGAYQWVIETQHISFIQEVSRETEDIRSSIRHSSAGTEPTESLIIAPLTLHGVPLGILSIQHSRSDAYGQEDLFVLQLLANYTSLALHNVRLYSSLIQLNETGQVLTQQIEAEHTLQATVEKIREATQADVVVLFPYDPVLRHFILPPHMTGILLDPTYPLATNLRPIDMAVLALNHQKPIFAKNSDASYAELRGHVQENQGNFKDREKIRSAAIVPLRVEEVPVGVLFINFRQSQRFDAIQKLLIEGLAHYAAIAIKNSQTFGALSRRRVRELEALQHIDRELSHALDRRSVLHTILKLAYECVPAEEASILLLNNRTQMLETAAAHGRHAETSQKQKLSLSETRGITLWVVKERESVRVKNVQRDLPWRDRYLPVAEDILSELDVPLLDGENVIGVLNVESTKEGAFQQEDQDILRTLAGQAVLAIKNSQAYEREKRLAEEERVLNHISKEIVGQLDPKPVLDLIIEKALELTDSTSGNLMIYDADRGDLWMAAVRGSTEKKEGTRQSLEEGIVGHVAKIRQMVTVEDLSQPPWNEVNLDIFPGTLSELAIPMLVGSELRGVLNVESESTYNYDESDERLLQGLADLAVIALQNLEAVQARKEIEKRALEAEQMSSFGQYVFEVTHRLGNDLGVVDPYVSDIRSELEQLGLENPYITKKLKNIHQTVKEVLSFSRDLKQRFAKLSGKEGTSEERVLLSPKILLEEVAAIPVSQPTIAICLEVADDAAPVQIFRNPVTDILRNLIINAIQALPDGGTITLRAHNDGRYVALQVSDTGTGISPEDLPKIFELFFSKKKEKGGTGFGLWSARHNALKNGGDLRVESTVGQGTTFTLLLLRADQGGVL